MPITVFLICYFGLEWSFVLSVAVGLLTELEPEIWKGLGTWADGLFREEA